MDIDFLWWDSSSGFWPLLWRVWELWPCIWMSESRVCVCVCVCVCVRARVCACSHMFLLVRHSHTTHAWHICSGSPTMSCFHLVQYYHVCTVGIGDSEWSHLGELHSYVCARFINVGLKYLKSLCVGSRLGVCHIFANLNDGCISFLPMSQVSYGNVNNVTIDILHLWCNRMHVENLASVFPLISLSDQVRFVQAWHQREPPSLCYNSILSNCE